ncbi:MAG: outer membrane protein assembly factor BamD [Candidatus Delongbacteria bacterium]|nr:outer membrane protein assembly factor BamD [Candidatus Delongbacteria bacterium]MCG2760282.1 outer membrane protein assembly factor BamD [Candidatus Delongbacteria bacterium]
MKIKLTMQFVSVSIISVLLFFISCSKELNSEKAGFYKNFQTAKKKYNDNNYREAINGLNSIILNYGGENGIDSVQFLIAKAHYELEEFYSASYEFSRLTDNFPESKLIEESYYQDAGCYKKLSPRYTLDQKETFTAISKYQLYLDLFPKGKYSKESSLNITELREKLARKEFEAGSLYLKLGQPRAARVYFNEIIDNYYDTSYYILSLEKIAQAYLEMKDDYSYKIYLSKFQELKNNLKK